MFVGLAIVTAVGTIAMALLLAVANKAVGDPTQARIDAIRTGLAVSYGAGGVLALILATRRQWLSERTQNYAEIDAEERRITELYTKAVDQVGSDKAAVRLGGLYALERLAQAQSAHRQTIVNVLCAYLRMHYFDELEDNGRTTRLDHASREELQVRLTAQRILCAHLRAPGTFGGDPYAFWPGIEIDLTGAVLMDLEFVEGEVEHASFDGAIFVGKSYFSYAHFELSASFRGAQFRGEAYFRATSFGLDATFEATEFGDDATFEDATFPDVSFQAANFAGSVASFAKATFQRSVNFDSARFTAAADLATASASIDDEEAVFERSWPAGWTIDTNKVDETGKWAPLVKIVDSQSPDDLAETESAPPEIASCDVGRPGPE